MVDVEQAGVGAFEQHALAGLHRIVQAVHGVGDVRSQALAGFAKALCQRIGVKRRSLHAKGLQFAGAKAADHVQALAQVGGIQQVAHADGGGAIHLVAVGRADAATRGADGQAARIVTGDAGHEVFQCRVLFLVVGHHHMGAVADQQVAAHLDAALTQAVDLLQQLLGIHHHAVADHADLVGVQDAAWHQVQGVAFAAHLHAVAGVGAAVVAHDHVMATGEQINDLALAFVAPLEAHHCGCVRVHRRNEC